MSVSPLELVERVRHEYFADTSLTHAELQVRQHGDNVTLSGTVLDRPAAELLLGTLSQRLPAINWRDEMTLLVSGPDYRWAVAKRAVLDIRREPSNGAERVSQILYGEPVEILREVGDWAFIRAQDGYLGWTPHAPLVTFAAEAVYEWRTSMNHVVRQPLLACYADWSGEPHQQMMLLPFGARLNVEGHDQVYSRVRSPEGTLRWVPSTGLWKSGEIVHTGLEGLHKVVDWAQALVGVPYLWGGKTPFGYDCSGLVQMFYQIVGVDLRRDAHQQSEQGRPVEFDELQFGDLIFLDTDVRAETLHAASHRLEVTHVMFSLGKSDFMHSSRRYGGVVRGSFDPHSPFYTPTYRERFIGARRYIDVS